MNQKKASNKIYRLTERFPNLITTTDTIIPFTVTAESFTLSSSHIIKTHELPLFRDSLVLKDSLNVITIKRDSNDNLLINTITKCPEREVQAHVPFSFKNIVAQCNCKKEIKEATAQLRRDRRRLIFLLLAIAVGAGVYIYSQFKNPLSWLK
jgi:hypothetical protein